MKSFNSRAARKAGFIAGAVYVAKINDLCAQAGKPERADGFIKRGASVAEVRGALGLGAASDRNGWDRAIEGLASTDRNKAPAKGWGAAITKLAKA